MREPSLFFRRNLPYLHPSEGVFFITYRLAGSIPKELLENKFLLGTKLITKKEREKKGSFSHIDEFNDFDNLLDDCHNEIAYLKDPKILQLNKDVLHVYDGKDYSLICYCIMSNHVHLVLKTMEGGRTLSQIMHSIKRFTARESNKILGKTGAFWQDESYDRYIRNHIEFRNTVNYVLNNPVKAGLIKDWRSWKGTYLSEDYL